uniref:Alkaline ceramidase n=1 Tax=Odontella aurita TaxID=265563 RepID=A0A7S4K532_9STRA|mmetsp:Transcript_61943/g.182993  ORF Transcript_61943/g.182993 Transcript_61943/m.182993 type:complete len:352 (+) Transcript_61943:309-1364(+)
MPSPIRAAPLTPPRFAAATAFVTAIAAALFLPRDEAGSTRSGGGAVPIELRLPIFVLAVASASFLLLVAPIPQDPSYHAFADRRGYLCGCCAGGGFGGFIPPEGNVAGPSGGDDGRHGRRRRGFVVPNFFDVTSNVVIFLGGVAGIAVLSLNNSAHGVEGDEWQLTVCLPVLFGATAVVSAGSCIYHWNPNSNTLVFDRLPMTVAFMAIFTFLLDERIQPLHGDVDTRDSSRVGPLILTPLVFLGSASVLYWHVTDDLRPYFLVQFVPILAVPVLLSLYPPRYTGQGHIISALFWYVVAKVCEEKDLEIYVATRKRVSGHTLKHITAGFVPFCIAYMLLVRKPIPASMHQD